MTDEQIVKKISEYVKARPSDATTRTHHTIEVGNNEFLVFHGTGNKDFINVLVAGGFEKGKGVGNMYGDGLYNNLCIEKTIYNIRRGDYGSYVVVSKLDKLDKVLILDPYFYALVHGSLTEDFIYDQLKALGVIKDEKPSYLDYNPRSIRVIRHRVMANDRLLGQSKRWGQEAYDYYMQKKGNFPTVSFRSAPILKEIYKYFGNKVDGVVYWGMNDNLCFLAYQGKISKLLKPLCTLDKYGEIVNQKVEYLGSSDEADIKRKRAQAVEKYHRYSGTTRASVLCRALNKKFSSVKQKEQFIDSICKSFNLEYDLLVKQMELDAKQAEKDANTMAFSFAQRPLETTNLYKFLLMYL